MVILGYPETGSAADKNSRPGHTPCPTAGSCREMGENHGEVGMEIPKNPPFFFNIANMALSKMVILHSCVK